MVQVLYYYLLGNQGSLLHVCDCDVLINRKPPFHRGLAMGQQKNLLYDFPQIFEWVLFGQLCMEEGVQSGVGTSGPL